MFFCPELTLNEALLRVIRNKFPKRTSVVRMGIILGWMTNKSWLTMESRRHIECGVVVGCKLIERSTGRLVVMLSICMWKLKEHSISGAWLFWQMHQIHGSDGRQLRRQSLVRALVCHLWWTQKVGWSGQHSKSPYCFRRSLTPNRVRIIFSNRILVIFVQYSVLLLSGLALLVVGFCARILMIGMTLTECFHFFYKQLALELAPKLAVIF